MGGGIAELGRRLRGGGARSREDGERGEDYPDGERGPDDDYASAMNG
jgi:hypothetical protein